MNKLKAPPKEKMVFIDRNLSPKDLLNVFGKDTLNGVSEMNYLISRKSKYALEQASYKSLDGHTGMYSYQGQRDKHFVPHGCGVMHFPNRDVYLGHYNHGVKDGKGSYTYHNGAFYLGHWKNGKKEGLGIMNYPDGSFYNGEWVADRRHGWGMYEFKNGDIFEGQFYKDNMHGEKCIYSFSNPPNIYYLGPFKNNGIRWTDCAQLGTGRLYRSKGVAVVNRLLYAERYPHIKTELVVKNFVPDEVDDEEK